ncbi:hypothetical protein KAW64_07590 [bacterium]|nr:hypothetical protein [bacterium]
MQKAVAGKFLDLRSPRGYHLAYAAFANRRESRDALDPPPTGSRRESVAHSPWLMARSALACLELYLESGNQERRAGFERIARWLIDNHEEEPGGFLGWPMPMVPRAFRGDLSDGWFSGSAHAECIAVLVRAGTLLNMEGAIDCARRAVIGFATPVEDGGFLREVGEEGHEGGLETMAFAEEYPIAGRASMTLGGHARAMFALSDFAALEGDDGVRALLERYARGLEYVLDQFDLGFWSRADLDSGWRGIRIASFTQHTEHVLQLSLLSCIRGCYGYDSTSERWETYARLRGHRWKSRLLVGRFRIMNPNLLSLSS